MKKILLSTGALFVGMLLFVEGKSQDSIASSPLDTIDSFNIFDKLSRSGEGKVILGGDDVKTIINESKTKKTATLKGWRIRIFRDNSQAASRKAEKIKSEINQTFPKLPVHIKYDSPLFSVEIGDYRTSEDAEKMRRLLLPAYPGASTVPVNINFPPL
jgi:hypothetical protein